MTEILKSAWGKLYAWALPGALTLGAYWLFVYPNTELAHSWLKSVSAPERGGLFVGLSAAIAFSLGTFSTHLYRILEGDLLWPKWLQDRCKERQRQRKRKLQQALSGSGWTRSLALERLGRYPLRDEQIFPTRFGNAIRSFETYGRTRFNLDLQTLWYELCAVAPKYIQTEIDWAKSSVDFFVASIYLSATLGLATFMIAAIEGFKLSILLICISAFFVTLLCHWLAVRSTDEWSSTVQALVNVARPKLADQLALQLPGSLEEEKVMWGLVSSYVSFGDAKDGAQIDRFRKAQTSAATAADTNAD